MGKGIGWLTAVACAMFLLAAAEAKSYSNWHVGAPSPAADRMCGPIDPSVCLLPWPNDFFTRPDRSTATGRRLAIDPLATPRNVAGAPIDTSDWNRLDGFSPGSPIVTHVPGMDTRRRSRTRTPDEHRHPAQPGPRFADRRDRREDGAALAGVGRVGPLGRFERQPAHAGADGVDHPPGVEPRRGAPLHRRPARPAGRGRQDDPPAVGVRRPRCWARRALPATALLPPKHLPSARARRHIAPVAVPRVGLHRRQPPKPH
jgi:hypothetical protein